MENYLKNKSDIEIRKLYAEYLEYSNTGLFPYGGEFRKATEYYEKITSGSAVSRTEKELLWEIARRWYLSQNLE